MRSLAPALVLTGALIVSSCGAPEPPPRQPRSVHALLTEAQRCEKEATEHDMVARAEQSAPSHASQCADTPLDHVSTTGGEPLRVFHPCWTLSIPLGDVHRRQAERLRAEAAQYRAQAQALLEMEQSACTGLSQDAIDHSPFFHAEDILRVEAYRVNESLRGARVLFRKVPGLTVEWLSRAIHCHQARAAVMGHATTFQSYCPLVLEDITASVSETSEGIEVLIRSERDDIAAAVLGRALDRMQTCAPRTARVMR
jgi:hypothetical protein